jgi:undecaprenyl diphosphate synthase
LKLPKHLAIIMDGNGRWAKARRHNRFFGHIRGARIAKNVIEDCARLGMNYLTLFAFSTENWFRPTEEVSFLMTLLARKLKRERPLLMKQNIKFCTIGDLSRLPIFVRDEVARTINATKNNSGMVLTFALSYGGRQELVEMAKALVEKAKSGDLKESEIDEATIAAHLPSSFLPDPDLIIRTSGEQRLSNFFLWQSAYSEIIFEETAWPDFTLAQLHTTLANYARSERRFGRTSDQLEALP